MPCLPFLFEMPARRAFGFVGDSQVHYALRAFLAARGPSTSVKMYSVLYFFTPVRCDVLIVLVVWARPRQLHSAKLTQDE